MKKFLSFSLQNKVIFFLDFDSTITKYDTCTSLPSEYSPLQTQWNRLSKKYGELYKETFLRYEDSNKLISELDLIEKIGVSMVEKNRILKGITEDQIRAFSEGVEIQEGCIDFIRRAMDADSVDSVHIISSNWCIEIISFVMEKYFDVFKVPKIGLFDTSKINIYSNWLEYDKSIATGDIVKRVVTSNDKVDYMEKICEISDYTCKTIYIGDSLIDVPATEFSTFGFFIKPDKNCEKVIMKKNENNILLVKNWDEIGEKF